LVSFSPLPPRQHGGLTGRIGDYFSYFVAKFNVTFAYGGIWKADQVSTTRASNNTISAVDPGNLENINGVGGFVGFDTNTKV
jgi:hypothetical protein